VPRIPAPCWFLAHLFLILPTSALAQEEFEVVAPINHTDPRYFSGSDYRFPVAGGLLFFSQYNGTSGEYLWKSDGTTSGTSVVRDDYVPTRFSGPQNFHPSGGRMFFQNADTVAGFELWVSDGSSTGTNLVEDLTPGTAGTLITGMAECGGRTLFLAYDGIRGSTLHSTDGSSSGTTPLKGFPWNDYSVTPMTAAGGKVYFIADDSVHGRELWVTNGTTQGTRMVKDLIPGTGGIESTELVPRGDEVFFIEPLGWWTEHTLWRSDGTEQGTVMVKEFFTDDYGSFGGLSTVGSLLYFCQSGISGVTTLWKSEGTESGTVPVRDIPSMQPNSIITRITDVNGLAFFVAEDSLAGAELWRSDGTSEGTTLVADVFPGIQSNGIPWGSYPHHLTPVNGSLYFIASHPTHPGLWRSDGTTSGTVPVPGYRGSMYGTLDLLTRNEGSLYYIQDDSSGYYNFQLWKMGSPRASASTSKGFKLQQNYPNPFNSGTTIEYTLLKSQHVRLTVHNILGEEVARLRDEPESAGDYQVSFGGLDLPSGVYFYRVLAGESSETRKFTLIR